MAFSLTNTFTTGSSYAASDANAVASAILAIVNGTTSATVATVENTTSGSYADLATTTDSVTVTIGASGIAVVFFSAQSAYVSGSGGNPLVGFAVSGTNTQAAADAFSAGSTLTQITSISGSFILTGLNPGSTTFKMKYKSSAGTATFSFSSRRIAVIPFP